MTAYNDELITIDKWPAATAVFDFKAGTGGNAGLALTITFQPDQVAQPKTALAYYQVIYDQLTDSRTSLTLTTALAAGPVNLTSTAGDNTRTALGNFVTAIIAYLTAITNDPPTAGVPPSPMVLSGTVNVSYVQQIGEDLFPIWVSIEISRVATDEYVYPDGFLDVVSQVSPLLSATDADPAALRTWAMNFESAFYNFAGQNALLKVAVCKPPTQISATRSKLGKAAAGAVPSIPGDLWALKWSSTDGVGVSFPNNVTKSPTNAQQQPIYFAPLPLSKVLTFGSFQISDYDATGNPITLQSPPTVTFTGIDIDGWASSFLHAFEELLSPELATKIAELDGDSFESLVKAKQQLAYAISSNISWIFKDQLPGQEKPGLGDSEGAQERFREGLLASLNADFGTSSIVQLPAKVSAKNTFETDGGHSSQPAAFFGNPSPTPGADIDHKQYTISTALLPITNQPGYLNFLVGTVDSGCDSDLKLPFFYDVGFIDRRLQTSEEQYGSMPSSRLRFVVPDTDPHNATARVLDIAMGTLDIPIPLRTCPSPPGLISQIAQATSPSPTTIREALKWNYNLQLARPLVAQDHLHLSILGNGQTLDRTVSTELGTEQGSNLFKALARFQDFQTRYFPQAISAILTNTTSAATWLGHIVALVQAVAAAWQPEPEKVTSTTESPSTATAAPAPFEWKFTMQVQHETELPNTLTLTWKGDPTATIPWPTMHIPPAVVGDSITEVSGVPVPASTLHVPPQRTYTLLAAGPRIDVINIVWSELSVITVRSLSAAAWIERNETLVPNQPTNPEFVYSTQTVSFQSPLVALLQVPTNLTIANTTSPADAVNQLVTQIMQPLTPVSQIGWSLEADYSFVLVSATPGTELATRLAVFRVKTAITTANCAPTTLPIVETVRDFESALLAALKAWHESTHPSDTNASLLFEVTLFASATQQPIARLLEVEIPVSGPSWWES